MSQRLATLQDGSSQAPAVRLRQPEGLFDESDLDGEERSFVGLWKVFGAFGGAGVALRVGKVAIAEIYDLTPASRAVALVGFGYAIQPKVIFDDTQCVPVRLSLIVLSGCPHWRRY